MKQIRKILSILSIFILAVAVFQFDGIKNKVNASETPILNDIIFPQKYQYDVDYQKEIQLAESLLNENSAIELPDQISIGEDIYENIMNEDKFSDWIQVARNHGAGLFALPYTDLFTIVKDEKPIVHISTGAASALEDHADILGELLAELEYGTEIQSDVEKVINTGEEINVELGDYQGYYIFKEEGWIYVMW